MRRKGDGMRRLIVVAFVMFGCGGGAKVIEEASPAVVACKASGFKGACVGTVCEEYLGNVSIATLEQTAPTVVMTRVNGLVHGSSV
jgi:hypothetical protein